MLIGSSDLRIPLNSHGFDDIIAWHLNRSGMFSVRTAYHEQLAHKFRAHVNAATGQGPVTSPVVWKQLWNLKVPRKTQIFGWIILHGIVPTKSILSNRHIGTSGECPLCQLDAEDLRHLLFECAPANELWRPLRLQQTIDT